MGSPFAPNEVPTPVCAAALTESRYHVRTAYEGFKVRYEESRAQCGHCVLLLSNTRITLYGCVANNRKQIFED